MSELEQAIELRNKILRGDIVMGIMPPEAFDELVARLTKIGEEGEPEAWWELGRVHATGINTFDPDPELAVLAWEKGWDVGGSREMGLALAQTSYFSRLDVVSPPKMRNILEELLEDDEDGAARLLLGWMHYAGYLFEADLEQAVRFQESAAERGNADAMFELSILHGNGEGVDRDEEESVAWCRRAAEAGSVRAMYNLAASYAAGRVVDQDDAAALQWYERAAENGHGRAAATLAYMYGFGEGAPEDHAAAAEYFDLAFDFGYDPFQLFDAMGVEPPFEV